MKQQYYESYEDFCRRIYSFQKQYFSFGVEKFTPNPSVEKKVAEDGTFREFIGDTVVFDLQDRLKKFIKETYIDPLYEVACECFAKPFHVDTLHMTLHDLNSSPQRDSVVMEKMFETEITLANRLGVADMKPEHIVMETTCVFNMVNTSMVLGLKPKTQEDFEKLMQLYYFVDDICQLPYPLTPHITLAYYRRQGFEGKDLWRIERVVNEINRESFSMTISTDRLYYQKFVNMNDFVNVMPFVR